MAGRFVALTGIDGAGKTTVAHLLCGLLNSRHGGRWSVVSRHSIVPDGHTLAPLAARTISAIWDPYSPLACVQAGDLFWFHLRMAWYWLASAAVAERLAKGESLVADDWYHKFYARLLASPKVPSYVETIVSAVLQPDVVILVDVDAEVAVRRKATIKAAEAGLHAGFDGASRSSFVAYQRMVSEQLRRLADNRGWPVVQGTAPPESVAASIAQLPCLASQGVGVRY